MRNRDWSGKLWKNCDYGHRNDDYGFHDGDHCNHNISYEHHFEKYTYYNITILLHGCSTCMCGQDWIESSDGLRYGATFGANDDKDVKIIAAP